jgi:anti-sigma B factor antagonist
MLAAQTRGLLAVFGNGQAAGGEAAWGWLRNGARMLRCVAEARVVEEVVVPAQHDPASAAPIELSHRTCPTGETVVDLGGELDILSAEVAVSYVRDIIDRHHGPVEVNLTALAFCDAKGLTALVRMARYAEQKDCPFRLASPNPSLVKIMRITGLDRRFLASQASALALVPPD